PNFKLADSVKEYAGELVTKKMSQELSFASIYSHFVQLQQIASNFPKKLNNILDRLNNDEFELRLHIDRSSDILKTIQKVANRITMGMITAALIIGSAIIMNIHTSFQLFGYPGLAIIGFLVASGFGAFLIGRMLFHDE